ncbi:hypothetical protein NDU88_007404 [Pleurodeles waltl]|uniref:Uncharacterized protein n=1 Tax=Pleurodeles waltl TaxID=8319 RepID=A0AAV7LRZ0_PLEWA|nr:hypothetical protein NDU88_007404 [Pleurodeles waltl]
MSPLGGDSGGAQQLTEPPQKQAAPAEVPEQALRRSVNSESQKEGPTTSDFNSASWAMQDGVLGTQARLCTKESFEKCSEARAAAYHAVDRDQARQDERGPRGPVMQKFGACVGRGKILLTYGRFLLGSQCRVKADSPQSMHHQEIVEKAGRMRCYNVAGSLLATLLRFCRRPGEVSGRSLAEVEEGSAEELW